MAITPLIAVDEGTTPKISITLTDETGTLIPDASINEVKVRIDDYNTEVEIRAWATASPSDSIVTVWFTEAETAILDDTQVMELKEVTVRVQYATSKYATSARHVQIDNLKFYDVT